MASSPIAVGTTNTTLGSIQTGQTPRIGIQSLTISHQGEAFIKGWESLVLHYYDDAFHYCTVGWGHLTGGHRNCHTQNIVVNTPITLSQAQILFNADKQRIEQNVRNEIHVPLFQREFDALCSLAFNTGSLMIAPHLRTKINQGQYADAAEELRDITNGGLTGLVVRRQREYDLYLHGIYNANH